jgi:hypothetical protein
MPIATLQAQNDAAWASEMLTAQRSMPTVVVGADGVSLYHVEEGGEPHGQRIGQAFFPAGFQSLMDQPPGLVPRSPTTQDRRPAMADLIQGQLDSPTVDIPLPSGDLLRVKGSPAGQRRMPLAISHLGGNRFLVQGGLSNAAGAWLVVNRPFNNGEDLILTCPLGSTVVVGFMRTHDDPSLWDLRFVTRTYTPQPVVGYSHPRTFEWFTGTVPFTVFEPLTAVSMSRSGSWTFTSFAPNVSHG